MRRCRDCEHCKNSDCHCPVPLAMDDGEYVLNQVNPTNPDRDASQCTCFKKRIEYCSKCGGATNGGRGYTLCWCGGD